MPLDFAPEAIEKDFAWAVGQMNAGKKVRRRVWAESYCLLFKHNKIHYNAYTNISERLCDWLNEGHYTATDWELFEDKPDSLSNHGFRLSIEGDRVYPDKAIKKSIKKLKENICNPIWSMKGTYTECKAVENEVFDYIDEVFGDKLNDN